jgi:hypothetical protein
VGAIRIKEGGEYRCGGRTGFLSGGEVGPWCEASPRRRDSSDDEFTHHRPPSPEIVPLHTVSGRHRTTGYALRGSTVTGGRSPPTRSSLSARRWGLGFTAMAQRGQQGEATLVLIARNRILTATRYSRQAQPVPALEGGEQGGRPGPPVPRGPLRYTICSFRVYAIF